MPRVIVALNDVGDQPRPPFLLDEEVQAIHIDDEHHSVQFLQRLEWALREAEGKPDTARSYLDVPTG